MKRAFYNAILTLCAGLLILSCTSYRYIDLQILQPAKIRLPYKATHFFILQPKRFRAISIDTIDSSYYQSVISGFNTGLRASLSDSPLFGDSAMIIAPYDTFIDLYRNTAFQERKRLYSLSVKSLYIKDTIFTTNILYNEFNCENCLYQKVLMIMFKIDILLKNAIMESPVDDFEISDSLIWTGPPMQNAMDTLIKFDKNAAYSNAGNYIATAYALRISPAWKTAERSLYYSPNYLMRKAYRNFSNNQVTQAIDLWSEVYKTGTRPLAARAAHNVALCYETIDALQQSREWLEKSIQAKKLLRSEEYLKLIQARINENDSLNLQLLGPK